MWLMDSGTNPWNSDVGYPQKVSISWNNFGDTGNMVLVEINIDELK